MSQNSSTTPDVGSLFQEAFDNGELTSGSLQVLQNIGTHFQAALGTPAEQVTASEVTLVGLLADNTGSVARFTSEILDGQHLLIDSLLESKQKDSIMFLTRYFDQVLNPYTMLEQAVRMDTTNYAASLGRTPLFDGSLELLAAAQAKVLEFASNGVPVRSVSVIFTDGADNASRHSAGDVETVVQDLLRAENHIVIGMGVDDGYTDFQKVFSSMGIPAQWILTPKNDASSIRRAFAVVSQSAVRASQGAGSFSQVALGGFATS